MRKTQAIAGSRATDGPEPPSNDAIAAQFDEVAELLEAHQANPFRTQAYRDAADTLRSLQRPVAEMLDAKGPEGLVELPHIGTALAGAIDQIVRTGRFGLLERLRGESAPERLFATVPGIGRVLAERLHEELGIETLSDLERAASDGRLLAVEGFGPKRLRGVQESLAGRFRRRPSSGLIVRRTTTGAQPPVSEILNVDEEYRSKVRSRKLPRIAPRRFNPTREAWLPILHTVRDDRHYTALFSNTSRAHELEMTHDWVVIYRDDKESGGQWTVVTAMFGPLSGRRIVRGREQECRDYYASMNGHA